MSKWSSFFFAAFLPAFVWQVAHAFANAGLAVANAVVSAARRSAVTFAASGFGGSAGGSGAFVAGGWLATALPEPVSVGTGSVRAVGCGGGFDPHATSAAAITETSVLVMREVLSSSDLDPVAGEIIGGCLVGDGAFRVLEPRVRGGIGELLANLDDREHPAHVDLIERTFAAEHRDIVALELHSHHTAHAGLAHL